MKRGADTLAGLLLGAAVAGLAAPGLGSAGKRGEPSGEFEAPVRLKAGGAFIDTGDAWGHASPWVVDVDGDGKRDLVVGDFSGKFRLYRNTGSNSRPVYKAAGFLQAGGKDAEVPIY